MVLEHLVAEDAARGMDPEVAGHAAGALESVAAAAAEATAPESL